MLRRFLIPIKVGSSLSCLDAGRQTHLQEAFMFTSNVGPLDRGIRIVVGLVVLSLLFIYPTSDWRYASLLGLVPLLTGLAGTCPLYSMLGLSTCSTQRG
ncbi:YgaP family membrane protein [Aminobacter sp. BA135]|uniref:YgaP family membrane protein n=1 Tax=Aminobacter sp. BA135 TaxID=537596 RepID=UPI003D7AC4E0